MKLQIQALIYTGPFQGSRMGLSNVSGHIVFIKNCSLFCTPTSFPSHSPTSDSTEMAFVIWGSGEKEVIKGCIQYGLSTWFMVDESQHINIQISRAAS